MVRSDPLSAFGERWNQKAKHQLTYEGEDEAAALRFVTTGITNLDNILGGGFPRGRTTQIYGAESSGKTLLTQFLIAQVQRDGGIAMYFDAERTYTPGWFKATGVDLDPEKFLLVRPDHLEQAMDMAEDALDSVKPDVLVIDSIAALVPQARMEAQMSDQDFRGLQPRKIGEGIQKLTNANRDTALIVVNQMRTDMSVKFGNPSKYPGGWALRHALSTVLLVKRGKWLSTTASSMDEALNALESGEARIKEGSLGSSQEAAASQRIGYVMRVSTEKNKQAPPQQDTEFRVMFSGEVDLIAGLLAQGIDAGAVEVGGGGYYSLPGVDEKIRGRPAVEALLKESPDLVKMLEETIYECS